MPTYAIGDIHGNLDELNNLLELVLPHLKPHDTLVFLGDYIDRGPDSKGCIERIIQLKAQLHGPVVTLLGNHEQWMLRTLDAPTRNSWLLAMEGLETIRSYSEAAAKEIARAVESLGPGMLIDHSPLPYQAFFDAVPSEHIRFFRELQPYYESPDVICVHGGMSLDGILDPSDVNLHVWGPIGFPEDYRGNRSVVYGHRSDAILCPDGSIGPNIGTNRTYGIDAIEHGVLMAMRFPDEALLLSTDSECP